MGRGWRWRLQFGRKKFFRLFACVQSNRGCPAPPLVGVTGHGVCLATQRDI